MFIHPECAKAMLPAALWRHSNKQVDQNSENRKGIIGWNLDRDVEFNSVSLIRNKRSDGKCPVPHSAMVSTEISDIIQCQQPRFKYPGS